MATPKGTTNNPNGRPPRCQALTELLRLELNKSILVNGKRISRKRVMAQLVADAVSTGRIRFPFDTEDSILTPKDWMEFVRWAFERVDGKPAQLLIPSSDPTAEFAQLHHHEDLVSAISQVKNDNQ